ncbi:MAG: hypothetical protein ABI682_13780 [Acidobacteriota bacterium]
MSSFMGIPIDGALFGAADPAFICDLSWPIIAEWSIVPEEEGDAGLAAPPICMPAMSCVFAAWFVGALEEVFGGSGAIFDMSWPIDE